MSPGPLGPSGTLAPLCLDDELQAESSESQLLQLRGDRMQTVAKHTIKIPEILLHVLEYLTANELVCAALVCKAWTIAIEVRWRHRPVPLSLLLENLSPLEPLLDDERTLAFQGMPSPAAWERVVKQFSNKVTHLSFDIELDEPSTAILRNTHSPRLCPNLKTLDIQIRTSALAYEKLQPLLELLIRRSPLLVDISLSNPDKPEGTFQRSVLQSVKTLGGLQMLELSLGTESQHVTDENMNELLQCLPRLRYLAICDPQWVFPIRGLQLSPRTLLSLAQHCPALEKVEGLPVDFTISQLEVTPDGGGETWATSTITFPSLTDLSFGSLSVYDGTIPKLANYLAVACSRLKAVTAREIRVDLQGNGFESRHSSELMNAFLLCRAAVREYQRDQTHHPRRGPSPSHSQGTRNTSRSSGTASSGGTATQSAADGEVADAIERAAEEKVRRRAMAVRALKEGHRLRNIYDKKRKEVAELDKTEERLRGNGSATSAGSARSRCSGSRHDNASTPTAGDWNARSKTTINPAHEGRSPADVVAGELDDAYAEAWAQYLSEWDGILRQPTPSPYHTFETIPWPTLHKPIELKDLSKYAIKTFFKFASHHGLSPRTPRIRRSVAVATNTVEETRNLIQVIQDGQMIWHPDRWNDWMKHVAQGEHEAVKKGADVVIRVLHRMSEQRKDKRAGSDGEA
ncbi:hypothetical protein FRB98_000437 [Tulasnella sp. 332]|nr:hypothetical protein FRB98_000437 [Tulasnella sp. 332]